MVPELNINPTTAAQVRDYLNHLKEVKSSIKYSELSIDKELNLFHITDAGELKITLSKSNYKIYQEL